MKSKVADIGGEAMHQTDSMKRYMEAIGEYPLLTPEEEVRLGNIIHGRNPNRKYKKAELKTTGRKGNTMKRLIAIMMTAGAITLASVYGVMAQDDSEKVKEPKELVSARTAYQNSVKAVVTPLTNKYVQQLEQMKKTLGGRGDAEGAMAVQREIDAQNVVVEVGTPKDPSKIKKFNPVGTWNASNNKFYIIVMENKTWKSSSDIFYGTWDVSGDTINFISTGGNSQKFNVPAKKQGTWSMNGGKTIYEMILKD